MWSDVQIHSIYNKTVSSQCLLSAFLNWFYGFYMSFGLIKIHHALNFCQPRKNWLYRSLRVAKDWLSYLYTVFRSKKTFFFYLLLDINWYLIKVIVYVKVLRWVFYIRTTQEHCASKIEFCTSYFFLEQKPTNNMYS